MIRGAARRVRPAGEPSMTSPRRCLSAPALSLFALALALAAGGCGPVGPIGSQIQKGQQLADTTLTGLDGKPVQFKALTEGKVALVDVWATWCGPCIAAMPHLQGLHNQFKADGFTVVGVMIDRNATSIGPGFMKDNKVSYPIVMDDDGERIQKLVGPVPGIPTLILVDRTGKVLDKWQGFAGEEILREAVEAAIKGQPAPAAQAPARSPAPSA
jgi:thiol-disulfide isomerase/thioredoxin